MGFELQLRWLDRWLREEENGIDAEPPVLIFVQGPDQWRYEHDWPLPDERRIRLYLSGAPSWTVASRNDGTLTAEPPEGQDEASYSFDPASSRSPVAVTMPTLTMVADGLPTLKETILPAGARREHGRLIMDKSGYEAQAVTWTSPVLAQPTEVTGFPRLVLWASVSRPDADFIAELTDVAPRGDGTWSSTQITRGYLRASAQFSRTGPTELAPGDVCRYEIELQPTSYVVPAGHRLRFAVQGAAIDPAIDVSWHGPGLGEHPYTVTHPHRARIRQLRRDPGHRLGAGPWLTTSSPRRPGRLRGGRDGPALRFLGVPYAQSPAVTGRFAAPVPHPHWDGVRDALAYGASSAQPDRGITIIPEPVIPGDNELNLNVFTPELGAARPSGAGVDPRRRLLRRVQRLPVVPGRGLRPGRGGAGQHQLPARRAGFPGGAGRPGEPGRAGLGPGPGVGGREHRGVRR